MRKFTNNIVSRCNLTSGTSGCYEKLNLWLKSEFCYILIELICTYIYSKTQKQSTWLTKQKLLCTCEHIPTYVTNYHTWVTSLPLVIYRTTSSLQHSSNYATPLFCRLGVSVQFLILFNCATLDSVTEQSLNSSIFILVALAPAVTSSKCLAWSGTHWCCPGALFAVLCCSLSCISVVADAPATCWCCLGALSAAMCCSLGCTSVVADVPAAELGTTTLGLW